MKNNLFCLLRQVSGNEKGFAMITIILLGSVLFAGTLPYIDLTMAQMRIVRASQHQLEAQAAAEAGIEEAAWECIYNNATFSGGSGWTTAGADKTKTTSLTNAVGSSIGSYTVTVAGWSGANPIFTVTGSSSLPGGSIPISMKAALKMDPLYVNAMTVRDTIHLWDNIVIDSYDSTAGPYSPGTARERAVIETNGEIMLNNNAIVHGDAGGAIVSNVCAEGVIKQTYGLWLPCAEPL